MIIPAERSIRLWQIKRGKIRDEKEGEDNISKYAKGGCEKSSTVQALAGCLTDSGYKCFVIDLDPQGNLSFSSEVKKTNRTIYKLLKDECKCEDAVQVNKCYDIIPSSFN
jgi:cellulose biosynthesis protein BcsQ